MGNARQQLSFAALDDLFGVPQDRRKEVAAWFQVGVGSENLGPIIELVLHRENYGFDLPFIQAHVTGPAIDALLSLIYKKPDSRLPTGTNLEPKTIEVCGGFAVNGRQAEALRIAFWKRAERAAGMAGFSGKISLGISGAIQEMVDNVLQHSERVATGIVGYRWVPGEFEFVVADAGIGVLNSLQKSREHCALSDHGRAMRLAFDGHSRFGLGQGRGCGFHQLFLSLAELHGTLRFRSGDHAIEIEGNGPGAATANTMQRSFFQGFMMSAICRQKKSHTPP